MEEILIVPTVPACVTINSMGEHLKKFMRRDEEKRGVEMK